MRTKSRRFTVLGVACLAASAIAVVPEAAPAGAVSSPGTVVTNTGHGYITKATYANGDVVSVYGATKVKLPGAAPVVSAAVVNGRMVHSSSGGATPDLSSVPTVNGKLQLPSTPSAHDELIALGAPAAVADEFKQFDSSPVASSTATAAKTNVVVPASATPFWYLCASDSASSGKITMYGCDRLLNAGGGYQEDEFLASATANGKEISGFEFGVNYPSGNAIITWKPSNVATYGSCTTTTTSVTYGGVTASSTDTECPQTFGLQVITGTTFESKWDGHGTGYSNTSRSDEGATLVHYGANRYPGLVWTMWWY